MTLNRLSSTTAIIAMVAVVGLVMGSGSAYADTAPGSINAQGFVQPYVYGPTPFLAPTTAQPTASFYSANSYANAVADQCQMTTPAGSSQPYTTPYSTATGPTATYMYGAGGSSNPSGFTGWCVNENVTLAGNPTTGSLDTSLDINHPCWVSGGTGYYGDCDVGPVVGYSQSATGSTGNIPTEEWFHLSGVFLKPGQFLDLADTTPWYTTHGHMAMVLPCKTDGSGTPLVRLYQGIIDAGVFTMEAPTMQYLNQLSNAVPGVCVYHFDIGNVTDADFPYNPTSTSPALTESANPFGVTDFALVNTSGQNVYFSQNFDRYTSTFSIANGFMNVIG